MRGLASSWKRRLRPHGGLVWIIAIAYLPFTISVSIYLHNRIKYRGVENWPSVPAEIVGSGGGHSSFPMSSPHGGPYAVPLDTTSVEFEYEVGGAVYRSSTGTPDDGSVTGLVLRRPTMAHYDPENPAVAVLIPSSYTGTGLLVLAAFSGVLAGAHLCFVASDWLGRWWFRAIAKR